MMHLLFNIHMYCVCQRVDPETSTVSTETSVLTGRVTTLFILVADILQRLVMAIGANEGLQHPPYAHPSLSRAPVC